MDDGYERRPRPSGPERQSGSESRSAPGTGRLPPNRAQSGPGSGGLLSRYGARDDQSEQGVQSGQAGGRGAWRALTGQARRLGENIRRAAGGERRPEHGDWRATDFAPEELEAWDREDSAPFAVPRDPDASDTTSERAAPRRADPRQYSGRYPATASRPRQSARSGPARDHRPGPANWDDEWDASWETGTWDTGWATGFQPSAEYARPSRTSDDQDSGFWAPGRREGNGYRYDDEDALSQSLATLAQLGAVGAPISRLDRLRLLVRRRPAAAAMLAFFLLGFMLTCCAPTIPLLRLGYDAADAARRVSNLQALFAGGSSALFNGAKLKEAQTEVDGITHDLYEINGAMTIAGAPLAAVSPQMRDLRLLVRMGFDLTAAGDEGLNVAQTLLSPLQGGALSTDSSTPGITTNDIEQARGVLADASSRLDDALAAYGSLDVAALPSQLRPGSRYGNLLSLLPTAQSALGEVSRLLDIAPALLGIGQPAYYLVIAMDRSELRPGGGFQGNYGILTLQGGKQSTNPPFALHDVYTLDQAYFDAIHGTPDQDCGNNVPQPPQYYWWWPYRVDANTTSCEVAWGLRDSNLSPDFPTNARTAMQITEDAGQVPNHGNLQGVIAFTPVLIEDLLQATGDLPMPAWHVTITAANLEHMIHEFQLGALKPPDGVDRKEFTHQMSSALLDRLKSLHGAAALKPVLTVAEQALKDKDLQIYFSDPRAELILQQLDLASQIYTGSGDGFYVSDTNFGGNKANQYVTEHQTDYVMLLPDGGALHRLQIAVTYNEQGPVYDGTEHQKGYQDLQRTYLPGDATILGYSGFNPTIFHGVCPDMTVEIIITDCAPSHVITQPTTISDVPGRTMVQGPITVWCGPELSIANYSNGEGTAEDNGCSTHPQPHTVNVYIEWYTPHAFTMDSGGHGTYSELVEKQPGSADFLVGSGNYLTVYVDTSQLHAAQPQLGDYSFANGDATDAFATLTQGKKPFISNQQLTSNTQVNFNF